MCLSKWRSRNRYALWILIVCSCQAGLLAQDQNPITLFTATDELGCRVEIAAVVGLDGSSAWVVRYFEEGDDLMWERPLQGGLRLRGSAVLPYREWRVALESGANGLGDGAFGPWLVLVTAVTQSAVPPKGLPARAGNQPITDNTGTGVPTSGPPPGSGGGKR